MKKVKAVPEGHHTVTPFLIVNGAEDFIGFAQKAFNGKVEGNIHWTDDHLVMNASVKIGDSLIMIADTMNDMPPEPGMLYLYVDDVDKIYKQAIAAKAESIQEPADMFYGDRASAVKDRWGNKWWIATHKEDMSMDELDRRAKENQQKRAVTH